MKLLDRPATDIIAVTMPCFGTTDRTKSNAVLLAERLGCTLKTIDIGEAVRRQLGERDRRTAAGGSPWLLVVSPRAAERRRQLPTGCRTVLLPGGAGGLLSGLDPAAAVSYGTGPRDTLTLSSREGRQLWCAIQRELVTVEGRVVERQELPLRLPDHMSPLSVLAAAGALLLLGVPPAELGRDRGAVRGGQG